MYKQLKPIPEDGIILDSNIKRQIDALKLSEQGKEVVRNTPVDYIELGKVSKLQKVYEKYITQLKLEQRSKENEFQILVQKNKLIERNSESLNTIILGLGVLLIVCFLLIKYYNKILAKIKNSHLPNEIYRKLDTKETIIISVILGIISGLLVGYYTGEIQYYTSKGYRTMDSYYSIKVFRFNYLLFSCICIVISGISYLYLSKKK
ncbi:hypothetical protein HZQ35_08695 [Elizabethkingia anophelis]|nr:hypothetical protein [Elizabethkingia anophelis]MCT3633680.1 hypothetical protein [Elizabethkingia anophelis]MCT3727856.1 hypothetical protein [Elizabethkingia anophelis]MCT3830387.1 hypothetical protein [Elizabethkingia anophelis]MCT3883884.1 hypothetical protein [Elizabethkingia anophelis]